MNQKLYCLPNSTHWFGCGWNHRDLFSDVLQATLISLRTSFLFSSMTLLLGVALGIIFYRFQKTFSDALLAFMGLFASIPWVLLGLLGMSYGFKGELFIGSLFVFGVWPTYAKLCFSHLQKRWFDPDTEAFRALGYPTKKILWKHLLKEVILKVIPILPMTMVGFVGFETSLVFLGLSTSSEHLHLGILLAEGRHVALIAPHVLLVPVSFLSMILLFLTKLSTWITGRFEFGPQSSILNNHVERV